MAQQVLNVALAFHQVSKVVRGAPRSFSRNGTRRCRALQVFPAQPLKKRQHLHLRRRKCVQNLYASRHDYLLETIEKYQAYPARPTSSKPVGDNRCLLFSSSRQHATSILSLSKDAGE